MIGPLQWLRAARAVVRITLDPTNLDEVFALAEITEQSDALHDAVEELRRDPEFARIVAERPRLGDVDQEALLRLEEGTLGRTYAEFMRARGLRHESLVLLDGQSDVDFVVNHFRETHDIWHVVTGFNTDVAGELGLQAFYRASVQGPLPVVLLAIGLFNSLLTGMDDVDARLDAIARGWLLGKRARPLFGMRWADHWETPLSELRAELQLQIAEVDTIVSAVVGGESSAAPTRHLGVA